MTDEDAYNIYQILRNERKAPELGNDSKFINEYEEDYLQGFDDYGVGESVYSNEYRQLTKKKSTHD
jgi:hypothetical protein